MCFRFIESGSYMGMMHSVGVQLLQEVLNIPAEKVYPLRVFTQLDMSSFAKKMDSKTGKFYFSD